MSCLRQCRICFLCNMLKIGIIGIAAVFFAVLLKRDRPELSMLLSVAAAL